MREIKFRGYAVEKMVNSQWLVGFGVSEIKFAEHYAKEVGRSSDWWLYTESGDYLVDPKSIGQYIGLKVNGNEIYEGDIIKFKHETWDDSEAEVSEVIWYGNSECTYPAFDLNDSRLKGFYECNVLSFILTSGDYEVEVIGNIYEVSEILK